MSQNKPVKSFSAGHVRAATWRNTDYYFDNGLADLELVTRKGREFIRIRESEAENED